MSEGIDYILDQVAEDIMGTNLYFTNERLHQIATQNLDNLIKYKYPYGSVYDNYEGEVRNNIVRTGLSAIQGVTDAIYGGINQIPGVNIEAPRAIKQRNKWEKMVNGAGEFGYGFAVGGGLGKLAGSVGMLGNGTGLISRGLRAVLMDNPGTAAMAGIGAGLSNGYFDPQTTYGKITSGVLGGFAGAGVPSVLKGGIKYSKNAWNDWFSNPYEGMEGASVQLKGYRYKPQEAIEALLKQQDGYVRAATKKKGIGDIDFVYGKGGDKGYGLAHIIDRRNSEGIDGQEFVRGIPELIENGVVQNRPSHLGRYYIDDSVREGVIRKDWNGKNRNWVVTSYNKKP